MRVTRQQWLASRVLDAPARGCSRHLYRSGKHGLASLCLIVAALTGGCGGVPVVGLHPEYPPLEKKTFALFSEFVPVDSLRPTFRWQPFPGAVDPGVESVQHVTYELRIWEAARGMPTKLKYARAGLELPVHRLEEPLDPSTRYLWSVRARFVVGERPRLTEWSMAGLTLRNETVPNLSCFRFETPVP